MSYYKRPIHSKICMHTSIFVFMRQYSCWCIPFIPRSTESLIFVLPVAPATETTSYQSDNSLSIVSSRWVDLRYSIKNLYGESCCASVPDKSIWYQSVPSLKFYKFNAIDHLFQQLNIQLVSYIHVDAF
jgi:hypothetical protein